MNLGLFLAAIEKNILNEYWVFCFQSEQEEYPSLFFSLLCTTMQRFYCHYRIQIISTEKMTIAEIKNFIATTFLGSATLYLITGMTTCTSKEQDELLLFFTFYQGPNKLFFFTGKTNIFKKKATNLIISLPSFIKTLECDMVLPLFSIQVMFLTQCLKKLKIYVDKLSLDQTCLFMQYMTVMGNKSEYFFEQWVSTIFAMDSSLFTLSQYFFANNASQFFLYWKQCEHVYNENFWVVFWSDQLWRAASYIILKKQGDGIGAKQIAYRLPFSFINSDWQKHTSHKLISAHQSLIHLDYHIKNGGKNSYIELFYVDFFANKFILSS